MEGVELMNRKDTKYFFHKGKLQGILQLMQADYRVLEIQGQKLFSYRNIYFDTDDFFCRLC